MLILVVVLSNISLQELYQVSATGETDNLKSMLLKLQEENQKLRLEYEGCANSQPGTGNTQTSNFLASLVKSPPRI